jgi:aminocarboxymuconate-semialdehyde decarboxylase
MHNRREFLRDVAGAGGLLFVGCGLAGASAQAVPVPGGSAKRGPVLINGRRITTVDIHAHCAVPKAAELLKQQVNPAALTLDGQPLADRLRHMDAQGIDVAVLSINPNWYEADRDLAAEIITVQNEALAAFCAEHGDRFAALASVALQYPDLAAEQLDRAITKMGLRGAAIGGSVAGRELADSSFHPFWAKAEALGALVFIHPQGSAAAAFGTRLRGNGALGVTMWNPIETSVALSHLIFEGTLDRFPRLKICAAHGGGYLPSYMNRSDYGCRVFPNQCKPGVPLKPPSEYLKRLYYDSIVFTPEALRHLAAEVGAGQIVMGTDYPYPWVNAPVDHILQTPGLSDDEREGMLGRTAASILGLPSRSRQQAERAVNLSPGLPPSGGPSKLGP